MKPFTLLFLFCVCGIRLFAQVSNSIPFTGSCQGYEISCYVNIAGHDSLIDLYTTTKPDTIDSQLCYRIPCASGDCSFPLSRNDSALYHNRSLHLLRPSPGARLRVNEKLFTGRLLLFFEYDLSYSLEPQTYRSQKQLQFKNGRQIR